MQDSKGTPLHWAVLPVALGGCGLLVAAEFSPLLEIRTDQVVLEGSEVGLHEYHGWALVPVIIAALPMAYGAAVGRSRPAALALAVLGVVAILIGLLVDLPATNDTGLYGERYMDAQASPRRGLWLELAGGAVLVLAAGVSLLASASASGPAARRGRSPARRRDGGRSPAPDHP